MFASPVDTDEDTFNPNEREGSQGPSAGISNNLDTFTLDNSDILADSDDDEDLLAPSICYTGNLYNATKPVVLTPEKAVPPIDGSPLTPLQPYKPSNRDEHKYRLTFDKLMADKSHRKERDAELAKMEALLEGRLRKGGFSHEEESFDINDTADDGGEDDGRDLQDCQLPNEVKSLLKEVQDFQEDLPGEDIFPQFQPKSMLSYIPLVLSDVQEKSFESTIVSMSKGNVRMLLCGNWIMHHYMMKLCPDSIADWLFQIMCHHPDQLIANSAFQVLWALLGAATEDTPNNPRGTRGMLWVPSIQRVIEMLTTLGANHSTLNPVKSNNPVLMREELSTTEEAMETSLVEGSADRNMFPVCNITLLVQFLTHCLQKSPKRFNTEDLRQLMIIVCRISLDLRLQSSLFDIQMCIAVILSSFEESQSKEEIRGLCKVLPQLSDHHHNLLHLAQIQPPSSQGIYLQRLLSVVLLCKFVSRFLLPDTDDERAERSTVHEDDTLDIPDEVKLSTLVSVVDKIKTHDRSDYFLLHTIISLLDLAVGNQDLSWSEKPSLEKLFNKLRKINGEIKDPRAVFMNRTKVKDIIVRTLGKFKFMISCIQPTKESKITGFFDYTSSDCHIETLKDTVKEEELSDQDTGTSLSSEEEKLTTEQELPGSSCEDSDILMDVNEDCREGLGEVITAELEEELLS